MIYIFFNERKLAYFVKNEMIKNFCKSDRCYPYSDILKMKLKRSESRRVILDQAMPILEGIFNEILPQYCIDRISFFCNNEVLEYLIKSFFV